MESGKRRAVDAAAADVVWNHQVDGVARALLIVERLGKDGIGFQVTAGLEAVAGAELLNATGQFGVSNAM